MFGESELRYLAALETPRARRGDRARARARHAVHRDQQAAVGRRRTCSRRPIACSVPLHAHVAADAADDRQAHEPARRSARAARELSRRAARHSRPRRVDHGRERHRQERVRARADRPRPSAGRRRCGGSAAQGGVGGDRHLSRADAASHGDSRHRPDQREGPVRRVLHARVEARRAGGAVRTLGRDARIRAARPRRNVTSTCWACRFRRCRCRSRPDATSPSSWKWPCGIICCDRVASTRRGGWPSASIDNCAANRPRTTSTSRKPKRTRCRSTTRSEADAERRAAREARTRQRRARQRRQATPARGRRR